MGRHKGSCYTDIIQRHVALTKTCVVHTGATCGRDVWRGYFVPATCSTVHLVELHGTRRGEKIPPKLVWHKYKSISSLEGTCAATYPWEHVPATFSSCDSYPGTCPCYTSLLPVASVYTTQVLLSLQRDPSCLSNFKAKTTSRTAGTSSENITVFLQTYRD